MAIRESSPVCPLPALPFGVFLAGMGRFDGATSAGLAIGLRIVGPAVVAAVPMLLRHTRRVLTLTADGFVAGRDDALLRRSDVAACGIAPGYSEAFTAITAIKLFHRPGCLPPKQRSWGRVARLPSRADGSGVTHAHPFAKARPIDEMRLFELFDERIRAARAREELARLGVWRKTRILP